MEMTELSTRADLPEDLKFLLKRYPRENWTGNPNVGPTAAFWLQRHAMFRELGGSLLNGATNYWEEKIGADDFRKWLVPRLQFFLSSLDDHHRVEDGAYFPRFQAIEPKLARGFEILDSDHHILHDNIERIIVTVNTLLQADARDKDALRWAADAHADASASMLGMLGRHLDDEEDLVIPLLMDRGEASLV
jgi:hemerythrin-like domain-containing protein